MSDLPTRELFEMVAPLSKQMWPNEGEVLVHAIMRKADDVLLTRDEWLATIDYQYILDWAIDVGGPNYMTDMEEVGDMLAAAVKENKR